MEWIHVLTIIFSQASIISGILFWFMSDIKSDIKKVEDDLKEQNARFNERFDLQNTRIDKLYQMFVDLLKEGKK